MRVGFFLGFVAAAVLTSVFGKRAKPVEAPSTADEAVTPESIASEIEAEVEKVRGEAKNIVEEIKDRWREAVQAGRDAAREKEEELRADYEDAKRPLPR